MRRSIFILLSAILTIVLLLSFTLSSCKAASTDQTEAIDSETIAALATTAAAETTATPETTAKEDIFAEPAELTFWWYGEEDSPGFTKYVEASCAAYKELHPNITSHSCTPGIRCSCA